MKFTLAVVMVSILAAVPGRASNINWTNKVSGNWNTAANWNPNAVPGASDVAIITNAGVTVTLNISPTVGGIILGTNGPGTVTLVMNGLTLTLNGPMTVNPSGSFTLDGGRLSGNTNAVLNGTFGWSAGSLDGNLTLSAGSTLNVTSASDHNLPNTIFTNNGTVVWSGGQIRGGGSQQTLIYNNGLWDAQGDVMLNNAYDSAGTVFNNAGTFRKSASAGGSTTVAGVVFNNTGNIDAQTNAIVLQGGGTLAGGLATNAAGLVVLNSGAFNIKGTVTCTNVQLNGGTLTGVNVITNGFNWVIGTWNGAASVTIAPNTILEVTSVNDHDLPNTVMTNNGTVAWSGGRIRGGGSQQTVIYNNGLWDSQGDLTLNNDYASAGTVFNNAGTLRKSASAGGSTVVAGGVIFTNTGVIDAQLNAIVLQGGGTLIGGQATNAVGLVVLNNGAFNINGTVTCTNVHLNGGTLTGVNVITNGFNWVVGAWNGAASVTIAPNTVLEVTSANDHDMANTAVTNNGAVAWSGGRIRGGGSQKTVICNYGLWDAQADLALNNDYDDAGTVFNNYGILRKSGGGPGLVSSTAFAGVVFNQLAGVIDVQNGTNGLSVAFQGGGNFTGGYITTNQSGWTVLNIGNFTLNGTVTGTNTWEYAGNLVGTNVIRGGLTWKAGHWDFAPFVTVAADSTLIIAGGAGNWMDMEYTILTNNGVVNWASGILRGGNGTTVYNCGLWDAQSDQAFGYAWGGTATFNNYGTFRKSGGGPEFANSTVFAGVAFNQVAGVVDVQNGTNGLSLVLQGGGNFTGGGITTNQFGLTVLAAGNFNLNGTATGTNIWENAGNLVGTNMINGGLTWMAGNWDSAPLVTIAANSTLVIAGGMGNYLDMEYAIVTNNGVVNWMSGNLRCGQGTSIYNNGLWDAQSDQTFQYAWGGTATFNNYGNLRKSGGASEFANATIFTGGIWFNQLGGVIDVQNGTNGLQLAFQGGGNFIGGYITTNQFGLTILGSGGGVVNYTLNGTVTGTNTWENFGNLVGTNVIRGGLTWVAGNWDSAQFVTITTNSTLIIAGGMGNLMDMEYAIVTNNGVVNWASGMLRAGMGATVYNNGLWNAQSDQTFQYAWGGTAAFNNYGTFRKMGGASEFTNATIFAGVPFNQLAGTIDVQNGTNGLQLALQGGGNLTGGYITTNQFGLTVLSVGNFNLYGTVTGTNTWETGGNLTGTNVISGALNWIAGNWNGAQVTVAPNSVLNLIAGLGNNLDMPVAIVTNNGVVNWFSGHVRGGIGTTNCNNGVWIVACDQQMQNPWGGVCVFNNNGAFVKNAGTNTSSTAVLGGVTFNNNGRLDSQLGIINLLGAYNLTNGTLNFGINGPTSYGIIGLAGAAPLTGTVSANLNNGYQPVSGNSFTNLYYGSFTGLFTNAVLPFADAWSTNYFPTYFVLNVLNAQPVFAALATNQFVVNELTTLTVTNSAADADVPAQTLAYNLVAGVSGMTVNPVTGLFTWTPQQTNSPSTNVVAVVVTDNGSPVLSATNTFTVVVNEVNVPATLPTVVTQIVNELQLLTVTNSATNANIHSTISGYALIGAPSNMIISATGIITWTPQQVQSPGTNLITTVVTNGNPFDLVNPKLTNTNQFTVIVREVNVAPSLPTVATQIVNELTLLTVTNAATNANIHSTISGYALADAPSNMVVSASGIITWTPAQAQSPGTNTITTIVTNSNPFDLINPRLTSTNQFTVIVKEVNVAPSLPTISTQIVDELKLLTVTNSATNANIHATISGYVLINPPTNAAISTNGVFTWTPQQTNSPSTNIITTVVTNTDLLDASNPHLTATNQFIVIVREVNVAPVLSVVATQTVDELTLLVFTNSATESNIHSTLGYLLVGAPAGMSINSSGVVNWTPAQAQSPATNTVTTIVTNTNPYDLVNPHLSATNTFTVIVREVNVAPVLPDIPTQMVNELSLLTVVNTATESNIHSTLTYTLINPPSGVNISADGIITWRPAESQKNTTNVIVTIVTNTNPYDLIHPHLSATNQFAVIVKPALVLMGPVWMGDGQFAFSLNDTTAGVNYTIEYSTNLVNWDPALSFNGPGGPITIIDPNAGIYPHRFYRVKHGP